MKTCSKCGVEKDATEFNRNGAGLQPKCRACEKAWRQVNREKLVEQDKARYRANRGKRLSQVKARYQANREKIVDYNKTWRQTNPEKRAEYQKAWNQVNREKRRAHNQKRRARKAGAAGSHTVEQWLGRRAFHDDKCVYCGATEDLQKEHQIPLARGGTDWPANLVPACPSCNYIKGTKTPKEYKQCLSRSRPT